jgi:hypothetical protein
MNFDEALSTLAGLYSELLPNWILMHDVEDGGFHERNLGPCRHKWIIYIHCPETSIKQASWCLLIAMNMLHSQQDA